MLIRFGNEVTVGRRLTDGSLANMMSPPSLWRRSTTGVGLASDGTVSNEVWRAITRFPVRPALLRSVSQTPLNARYPLTDLRREGGFWMTLEDDLRKDIASYLAKARANYRVAYALSLLAIFSSFAAGLSVAGAFFSKVTLVILSSLPAGVLIAADRLKLQERAAWHYRMTYALQGLLNELLYEAKTPAEVSAQRRQLDKDLQPLWPEFGKARSTEP
jgi:hypothetical protein